MPALCSPWSWADPFLWQGSPSEPLGDERRLQGDAQGIKKQANKHINTWNNNAGRLRLKSSTKEKKNPIL